MQFTRRKLTSLLALILVSLVLIELVMVRDHQAQSASLKKKIYLKKFKKLLPLLMLAKAKKKIIVLPIPIPMFSKQSHGMDQGFDMSGGHEMMDQGFPNGGSYNSDSHGGSSGHQTSGSY